MALINCKDCGSQISDKADVCINCGCPIEEEVETENNISRIKRFISITLLAFFIVGGYSIYSNLTENDKSKVSNAINFVTNQPTTLYDEEMQIQEDQYRAFPVEMKKSGEVTIEYNILSGTNLDVYFMESSQYEKWQNIMKNGIGEEVFYNTELSTFGLSASSKTQQVEQGTYYIVLDNTDYGATYPPMNFINDISTLNFLVTVK
ncbi:hypothetical protein RCG23_25220 [Neobacillus sp. PS3-34]|uniref:hypothetical protein n=1 Tax=Neobacillus sp. PS3-34 TaxID=3070678 RepID=UPI0027DF1FE4|nr:hypothetical protein [Neobacillus sp. PS3-34]WML48488.1 hypothetical protein RCG23_25220 [Neobacillus sp. PS3-34]